jgi:outer membrane protein TolC
VGAAALARARESRRILRDRYEQGLAGVGDVLRASQDVLDTELLLIAARVDAVVEGAALERAAGAQE